MGDLARRLLPILTLAAACGRHPLPRNPRHDGATDPPSSFVEAPAVEAGQPTYRESTERYSQIAAGSEKTCGLTTDGRVRCWGEFGDCRDVQGECPAEGDRFVPKRVDQTAKRLSVGANYACAISLDDSINCWGATSPPVEVAPAHVEGAFIALSIPFAIQASDGAIVNFDSAWVARSIPAGSFTDVSGHFYYCGLRSDGTLTCWGSSRSDGMTYQPPGGTFTQLAVANGFGCAVRTDSQALCWGGGTEAGSAYPERFTPFPGGTFAQLAVAGDWGCGVRLDGSLACWGDLSGFEPPPGQYVQVSAGVDNLPDPLGSGQAFFCALRADGIVVCWGANSDGESSPP